jgi:ribonuclease D
MVINKLVLASGTLLLFGLTIWTIHRSKKRKCIKNELKSILEKRMCFGRSEVVVSIIQSDEDWRTIGNLFAQRSSLYQILGLDLEWVDNGKVALMQLALPDGSCILIRLPFLTAIPDQLQDLLKRPDIIKLGVGIKQDCDRLYKDYGINCNSWVDIRYIVHSKRPGLKSLGMGSIAKQVLNITIDKDATIRRSNWSNGDCDGKYSQRQIEYAANDALIATSAILSLMIENTESTISLWRLENVNTYEELITKASSSCLKYKELEFKDKFVKRNENQAYPSNGKTRKASPELDIRGKI